ncbi:MAG: hypothetical protein U9Q08_02575 [Candidatus Omnitrophota bacterium]|nr:hypothetical protein [Candidatus Omnitrophota bacterium]
MERLKIILMICPNCYKSFTAQTQLCPQCKVKLLEAKHQHLQKITKNIKDKRKRIKGKG